MRRRSSFADRNVKTAALGLFNGLQIKLPNPKALPEAKDEWVVILGGAGSVGQYAVQVRNLCVAILYRLDPKLK